MFNRILTMLALLLAPCVARAADAPAGPPRPKESDFYKLVSYKIPDSVALECGAMEFVPDGRLAVATRFGDIYFVSNLDSKFNTPQFTRWAGGLHEVLGLAYNKRDGYLYAVQRGEVSRLKDSDNDGAADVFETFCDDWGISGDYHEYAMGSKFDSQGNLYVLLTLTGSFTSDARFRGWCLKITPDGKAHPFASGIRSPGGVGFDANGELFYTDNQGPWNGTSMLKHLTFRSFQGHPIGNKWYDDPAAKDMGPRPVDPHSGSRFHIEAERIPQYVLPPVLLPHEKVGQSASGIQCDFSGGKFGPYAGHLFVGDQHHSNLTRCVLEKVNGKLQGVAIPFASGFGSGVVPVIQSPTDGSLFVGGTNRGWGSIGPRPFSLDHLTWTGKTPFELLDMKVAPDGFTLHFTQPVDPKTAGDVASYKMETYTYIFQAEYGSPRVDGTTPTIKSAKVSPDGKSVKLVVDGLKIGSVHELHLDGVTSPAGLGLLHPVAYYTLWGIPAGAAR
jgi:glucose/arabinose dehydrogenase